VFERQGQSAGVDIMRRTLTIRRKVIALPFLLVGTLVALTFFEARHEYKSRELVAAVKHNDYRAVTHLLADGADPNAAVRPWTQARPGDYIWRLLRRPSRRRSPTALILAARLRNREIVDALLGRGADANARDQHCVTALMLAAEDEGTLVKARGTGRRNTPQHQ